MHAGFETKEELAAHVVVVDDDQELCALLHDALTQQGHTVTTHGQADEALETIRRGSCDLLLADVNLPGQGGLELCATLARERPALPVIVMTAFGSMDTAISALRAGAFDFVTKPIELDALALFVQRALGHGLLQSEVDRLRRQAARGAELGRLQGQSRAMQKVFGLIERLSDSETAVLLTGESGTGKELAARELHERSRREGQFIAINCAAMPPALLESELFGHSQGAFTDARTKHTGLFVKATGGTLFLDEIGEMATDMQTKLLRVLQEARVRPVGSSEEIPFDTRIITATNRDLAADVEENRFRADLYYRINVVEIEMPPLRARGRDVLLLAQRFVEELSERAGKSIAGMSPAFMRQLLDYDWPGNVRELRNCLERAVALTRHEQLQVDDLPDNIRTYESDELTLRSDDPERLLTLEELERRYIRQVLKATGGNKSQAARVLGVDRRTLYRKLERFEGSDET